MYSSISTLGKKKEIDRFSCFKIVCNSGRYLIAHLFHSLSMVPGTSPIDVLSAARCIGVFKTAFCRKDSVRSSSGISDMNQARAGVGLVRVAEERLPVLTCSPAAVSSSKELSPRFFCCFLQRYKAFVSACCVPS